MSVLRGKINDDKIVVINVVAIIVCAAIVASPWILPRPTPETPEPPTLTLHILTQDDISTQIAIEESFLNSTLAQQHNIGDIEWTTLPSNLWYDRVGSGFFDIIMGSMDRVLQFDGMLGRINQDIAFGINESIAGINLKGYDGQYIIWIGYGFYVTIFELLVNVTLLQENGLPIPLTVDDLLSPQYHQVNSSLIGWDIPSHLSIEHQFQDLVTSSLGWETGIQKLTTLYANSRIYESFGDAEEALRNGEVAITLTTFTGRPHELLHPSLFQTHLENQVVLVPDVVGIDRSTQQHEQAEVFIEYLLSPECQSEMLQVAAIRMPIRREAFDINPGAVDESIYVEFNWTTRTSGSGVTDLLTWGDYSLWLYMNSTAFSTTRNLTNCWMNIYTAYENSSIDYEQFVEFRERLGEPLTIIDPDTLRNETFSEEFAYYLTHYSPLSLEEYQWELFQRWKVAANSRYETILNALSEVI